MTCNLQSTTHPVFGKLVRDGDFPWWKGRLQYPSLAACRIRFILGWEGEVYPADPMRNRKAQPLSESVSLMVCDKAATGPTPTQEATYHYLVQHQQAIATAVFTALLPYAIEAIGVARHEAEEVGSIEEFDAAIQDNSLDSLEGLRQQIELIEIGFIEEHKDGLAYLSFDFNCGWEEEHGVSVVVHAGTVLVVGGCADFYNRGSGLEAHIEGIRSRQQG